MCELFTKSVEKVGIEYKSSGFIDRRGNHCSIREVDDFMLLMILVYSCAFNLTKFVNLSQKVEMQEGSTDRKSYVFSLVHAVTTTPYDLLLTGTLFMIRIYSCAFNYRLQN